jgi:hypothetical protein
VKDRNACRERIHRVRRSVFIASAEDRLHPHFPSSFTMHRERGLAFQATLEVEPADKRLSLVLRSGLMIGS